MKTVTEYIALALEKYPGAVRIMVDPDSISIRGFMPDGPRLIADHIVSFEAYRLAKQASSTGLPADILAYYSFLDNQGDHFSALFRHLDHEAWAIDYEAGELK